MFEWSEQHTIATVNTLDQRYILCADYDRDMVLVEALRQFREDNESANVMIFTNTKKFASTKNLSTIKSRANFINHFPDAVNCCQ